MRPIYIITIILALTYCSPPKDKFNYETSIAAITYEAEMKYLDSRLSFYENLSEKGKYYSKENQALDRAVSSLKETIRRGEQINAKEQEDFLNHFESTFNQSPYVDFENYTKLKKIPFKTLADVDLVKRYIKNCFFYILNDNKLLPFDTYGPLACAEKGTIKDGEAFVYRLSINAFNSKQPFEWYLVKDNEKPLSKDNIIDTLKADETGAVFGETTKYKKGENILHIVSRLRMTEGDRTLGTSVNFFVK